MLKLEKKAKFMMKRESSPKQTAIELIRNSKTFLIITHERPDGDAIGSCLALKRALEKMGKKVDVIIPDETPIDYDFLPGMGKVIRDIKLNRDLIVNIKKVSRVSYNKREDGSVDLIITPSEGQELKKSDVGIDLGKSSYDVLVILDTTDLNRVNAVYEENKEILSNTRIINIDHHPTNNVFGSINIVDPIATSTCEIIFSLIEALDKDLIDTEIATSLLTGIISDTNRFQNINTTPKSLTIAAQLIASGANRSDIVKNMFRTKSVSTLKLWGKILSNIKEDLSNKIVWSTISANEMNEVGANQTQTEGIIDELLSSAPGANVVLLLSEKLPGLVTGSMRTLSDDVELDKLATSLGGGGHKKAAGFKVEGVSLPDVEKIVIGKLKTYFSGVKTELPKEEKVLGVEKQEVVFEKPKPKIVGQSIEQPVQKQSIQLEDDLYAPALSDLAMENPNIVEGKSSILQKIVEQKREPREELDFAKMEQELRKQKGRVPSEENPTPGDLEDFDEDYE